MYLYSWPKREMCEDIPHENCYKGAAPKQVLQFEKKSKYCYIIS